MADIPVSDDLIRVLINRPETDPLLWSQRKATTVKVFPTSSHTWNPKLVLASESGSTKIL